MSYECLNCWKIGDCSETSEEKALQKYHCVQWEAAEPETIEARNAVLRLLGPAGLKSILNTKPKKK